MKNQINNIKKSGRYKLKLCGFIPIPIFFISFQLKNIVFLFFNFEYDFLYLVQNPENSMTLYSVRSKLKKLNVIFQNTFVS